MFLEFALATKVKNALIFGEIRQPFCAEDVDIWRAIRNPTQCDGSPYLVDTPSLLSNATIRFGEDGEIKITSNRNKKFLVRQKGEDGRWHYRLDPVATDPMCLVDRFGRRLDRDGNPESKRPTS